MSSRFPSLFSLIASALPLRCSSCRVAGVNELVSLSATWRRPSRLESGRRLNWRFYCISSPCSSWQRLRNFSVLYYQYERVPTWFVIFGRRSVRKQTEREHFEENRKSHQVHERVSCWVWNQRDREPIGRLLRWCDALSETWTYFLPNRPLLSSFLLISLLILETILRGHTETHIKVNSHHTKINTIPS